MILSRAIAYRLFSGSGRPVANLTFRMLAFGITLALLTAMATRFTPQLTVNYSVPTRLALIFLLSTTFVTILFVLSDGYQRVFMARLRILDYLPLPRRRMIGLSLLAFLPLTLLACALVVPVMCRAFSGQQPVILSVVICAVCCLIPVATNIALRIFASPITSHPQLGRLLMTGLSLAIAWRVNTAPEQGWAQIVLVATLLMILIPVYLSRRPLRSNDILYSLPVGEWQNPNMFTQLPIRAVRTGRYLGANGLLAAALLCLILVAWRLPTVVPFDAGCMFVLLLAGTFGQEARTLSKRRYPIELVQYGELCRWLAATWALAFVNALLFVGLCLTAASLWFPDAINVGYGRVACIAICLIAGAILSGSAIVPQKQDILAQFASTGLYAIVAWGVLKVLSSSISPVILSAAIVSACLLLSYVFERKRWVATYCKT